MSSYPCSVCRQPCQWDQAAICCDICDQWVHFKCSLMDIAAFETLTNTELNYYCFPCVKSILPFDVYQCSLEHRVPQEVSTNLPKLELSEFDFENIQDCCTLNMDKLSVSKFMPQYSKHMPFLLIHFNIRSIQKNYEDLVTLLHDINPYPSVICLSETKLQQDPIKNISIEGYTFLHSPSKKKSGGVGLYIVNGLCPKVIEVYNLMDAGCEELWVEIPLKISQHSSLVIGVIYRHPNSNTNSFLDNLSYSLYKLSHDKKKIFIVGDMNVNLLSQSKYILNYISMLKSHSTVPLITHPTRVTPGSSTLLDHIYTNLEDVALQPIVLQNDLFSAKFLIKHQTVQIVKN